MGTRKIPSTFQQNFITIHQPKLVLSTARESEICRTFSAILYSENALLHCNQHIGYCTLNQIFSAKTFVIKLFKNLEQGSHAFVNKKFPTFSIPKFAQNKLSSKDGSTGGTFRICVLRTSHLEPHRISVPYFSSIFEAYRTNVPYPYHYKKSVPYFLAKIEMYRTVLPILLLTTRNFN